MSRQEEQFEILRKLRDPQDKADPVVLIERLDQIERD